MLLLLSFFSFPMECDDAFFFVKEERCILFPFLRKRKEDGWHSLASALEKFLSGRDKDASLCRERRKEKKDDLSFFFSVSRRKKRRNVVPLLEEKKKWEKEKEDRRPL